MSIRVLRVKDAVGPRLYHDYKCIELGFKGAVKRRGEVVAAGDVELLKRCGHYYIYVYDEEPLRPGHVHEVEAVERFARALA